MLFEWSDVNLGLTSTDGVMLLSCDEEVGGKVKALREFLRISMTCYSSNLSIDGDSFDNMELACTTCLEPWRSG